MSAAVAAVVTSDRKVKSTVTLSGLGAIEWDCSDPLLESDAALARLKRDCKEASAMFGHDLVVIERDLMAAVIMSANELAALKTVSEGFHRGACTPC